MLTLNTSISKIPLVGLAYVKRLEKINIKTAGDLLYHFPFRYDDLSKVSSIAATRAGETLTVQGEIITLKTSYLRSRRTIQKGLLQDPTGLLEVTWFNQPFLVNALKGKRVALAGKIETFAGRKTMTSPEYEIIENYTLHPKPLTLSPVHTGRLVPVYHETAGVSSKWLRSRIAFLLNNLEADEFLPDAVLKNYRLAKLPSALRAFHFPQNTKDINIARRRFAFEELFLIHLKTLNRKKAWEKKKLACRLKIDAGKILAFQESLPFNLTLAQKKALREILADLAKDKPMNRLLEGDVGSGKTVVAAAAFLAAHLNHVQSAFMSPTEILAQQHFKTLKQILKPFGLKISLLTGSSQTSNFPGLAEAQPRAGELQTSPASPRRSRGRANFDLLVGTHALINKRARFDQLGLVIIDEQHRFGVAQRTQLTRKGGTPHLLTMTATPIPRTVALTLYGDLDLSVLDELPVGRQKVKTWVVPNQKRTAAYDWIRKQVKDPDRQAFIVCPLIEESSHETFRSVRAVKTEFDKLQKDVFPDLRLGLLHGRLKAAEKSSVIERLKKGRLDILVSTPVVEVGIDIPSATVMVIEAADRFGLAQLHQLRGRVGRGEVQSYCLLFSEQTGPKTYRRLKAMETSHSGFRLAELDLKFRGPGEIYGVTQHGFFDLKVASFSDRQLIEETKTAASKLITKGSLLRDYPLLKAKLEKGKMGDIDPN